MSPSQPLSPAKDPPQSFPVQPLKPRRRLFYVLLTLFIVWVAILLTMYFTTVYPLRHPSPATLPASHPVTL